MQHMMLKVIIGFYSLLIPNLNKKFRHFSVSLFLSASLLSSMDSEFKLLISVKNQSVSPGGRTPLIIQWDHSGRQEALQEGAVINPSCGGVFQRTPPPASLLQLLPSV